MADDDPLDPFGVKRPYWQRHYGVWSDPLEGRGHDAPPSARDLRLIIAWGVGIVLFAVAVAALLVAFDIEV